jgi:hypothetical protein
MPSLASSGIWTSASLKSRVVSPLSGRRLTPTRWLILVYCRSVALERQMARGTEPPCYRCGNPILPEQLIVRKPSDRPAGFPDTFTVGGKGYVWVHEKCSPQKTKRHIVGAHKRNKRHGRR